MKQDENKAASYLLLAVTVLVCCFELFWFGSKVIREIDYDGMAYTGIARHLIHGQYSSSINGFRSPLLSWIIALASLGRADLVWVGKLINVSAFLAALALLYIFAKSLWHSQTVASVAVALFALGRGHIVNTVTMVVPDFLFAALTLVYFIVLLRCLRQPTSKNWFYLGAVHGVAFLAKAFALPWLGLCTFAAAALSVGGWKKKGLRLASAAIIPIVVLAAWACVLHSKYGVFTSGTQFKANLLQWTLRPQHPDPTYSVMLDLSQTMDEYMVDDPMPPHSWPWVYRISVRQALPKIIQAEKRNIPMVVKELLIVATPGAAIAFLFILGIFAPSKKRRNEHPIESITVAVIAWAAIILVGAYCMLVFDARYLYPLTALVLAVAARFLVPVDVPAGVQFGAPLGKLDHPVARKICVALVLLGIVFSIVYPSSPFRRIKRDSQLVCYETGSLLKSHNASTIVSIGSGPFPEFGVGWEAGYKAAYFGGQRSIAAAESLPPSTRLPELMADIAKAGPDAIVIWGRPNDTAYTAVVSTIVSRFASTQTKIADPDLGEVGVVLFLAHS